MKNISPELQSHISQDVTTTTKCYKITCTDGDSYHFCQLDSNITIDGDEYISLATSTYGHKATQLDYDNSNFAVALDSPNINKSNVVAGKFNYAHITIFIVNYEDITQGKLTIFDGYMGEIKLDEGKFSAEISAISSKLDKRIGDIFSPLCRAEFGSSQCGYQPLDGESCNKEFSNCKSYDNAINFRGEPHIPSSLK